MAIRLGAGWGCWITTGRRAGRGRRPYKRSGRPERWSSGSTRCLRQARGNAVEDSGPAHHERLGCHRWWLRGRRAGRGRRPYARTWGRWPRGAGPLDYDRRTGGSGDAAPTQEPGGASRAGQGPWTTTGRRAGRGRPPSQEPGGAGRAGQGPWTTTGRRAGRGRPPSQEPGGAGRAGQGPWTTTGRRAGRGRRLYARTWGRRPGGAGPLDHDRRTGGSGTRPYARRRSAPDRAWWGRLCDDGIHGRTVGNGFGWFPGTRTLVGRSVGRCDCRGTTTRRRAPMR